jgi:hypothetical protein
LAAAVAERIRGFDEVFIVVEGRGAQELQRAVLASGDEPDEAMSAPPLAGPVRSPLVGHLPDEGEGATNEDDADVDDDDLDDEDDDDDDDDPEDDELDEDDDALDEDTDELDDADDDDDLDDEDDDDDDDPEDDGKPSPPKGKA